MQHVVIEIENDITEPLEDYVKKEFKTDFLCIERCMTKKYHNTNTLIIHYDNPYALIKLGSSIEIVKKKLQKNY